MKRSSFFVPLLAILTLVMAAMFVGCDRQPLESVPDEALTPLSKGNWVEETVEISIEPFEEYIDCIGEMVTWHGSWYFITRTMITPSGNEVWHFSTGYDTPTPLRFVGQASAKVWTQRNGESYGGSITKPRGTAYTFHFQGNEFYTTQNGVRLHVHWTGRVMIDANGTVTQNRDAWSYSCN